MLGVSLPAFAQLNVLGNANTPASTYTSEQVHAQLVAHAPGGIAAGQTIWLGLKLKHQPHWHTYWRNSGDSGLPTQIEWQLPSDVQAGSIDWPTPRKFPLGPLANYGYSDEVLLPTPLHIGPTWRGDTLTVKAQASWLACKTECIPEEASFELRLDTRNPPTLHGRAFESALESRPKPVEASNSQIRVEHDGLRLDLGDLPVAWAGKLLDVFPEEANLIAPGASWTQTWNGNRWKAHLPFSDMRSTSPSTMQVVVAPQDNSQRWAGVRLELRVNGNWPPTAAPPALPTALQEALAQPTPNASEPALTSWLLAVAGAFVGGLILNLMPCVFPILAIKVLTFSGGHGHAARMHRMAGLAYTTGVVASFMVLGGLLLGLRAAGEQLGWGFQLQSPGTVAALAVLFTLMGLNLAGLFELGQVLPSSLASLQARHPVVDAALTGVLATAIASPCTAPFMGASLGLAVTLPWAQALAVFASMGLGMALPYLAASWFPRVAQALPKPGAWMNRFKQLMAFPMWATVVWLLWVLGQQTGIHGAMALLGWLVALALVVWAWAQTGPSRKWLGTGATALLLGLAFAWAPMVLNEEVAASDPTPSAQQATDPTPLTPGTWHTWTPERARTLRASGTPVLVDFTAAWCVTCQYNKRTTLNDAELLNDLANRGIVLLRADWTKRDSAVTSALAEVGRSGVPTYVVYQANRPPVVLSELPTVVEIGSAFGIR